MKSSPAGVAASAAGWNHCIPFFCSRLGPNTFGEFANACLTSSRSQTTNVSVPERSTQKEL